ncbi:MAG: BatA and WFA domain-containing protein [Planctomycetaceae bacterium]|nr:BatA and WFA domain-containing protein [Planctomycetaceae bacterium]
MTFLHPWAIVLGIVAAGIPIAVHLLTKPRPVRMPLSTLKFLQEAVHQRRARHVVRDVLILLLRTLAILLIALAVAQPQWGARPLISDQLDGDTVRVVALDISQSMAATDRGVAAFERARTRAATFLRYHPGLKTNLLLVGADTHAVFDSPSVNFDQLREELANAEVLPQRVDVRKFVEAAGKMLAPISPDDQRRRELVIISDFQRSGWARIDMTSLPDGTLIQWESVAPTERLPNLAILDVRVNAQEWGGGSSLCEIDVFNGTPHSRLVEVELQVGESLWHLKATCPPDEITTLSQELQWKQTGWQPGEARLVDVDDALPADNVRPFAVRIPEEPVYVLLTRQPATLRPSASWFLECALPQGETTTIHRADPSEADATLLALADVILIAHPGRISDETVRLLSAFFRRGTPIFYVTAESHDAVNLQALLDMLGESVQLPVEFTPPLAGRQRRDLTLASVKRDRPPFNVFGDHLSGILEQLRFSGGLDSRRLPGRHDDDLLAVYSDGSASLLSITTDAGTLAILNADLNESNLARSGAFVPLIEELLRGLMDTRLGNETAYPGEPVFVQLPGEAGSALVLQAVDLLGTEENCGELLDEETGTIWRWNNPIRPGVYGIKRGEEIVFAQAACIPAEESDLESLDLQALAVRLAGGHATYYHSITDGERRRSDFWIWFVVACVLCMVSEIGVMLAFRD